MAMPPPPPPPMSHSRLEEGLRPGGPPDEQVAGFVVCMNVINTVTHLLLGAVAFCAFICINMISIFTNDFFNMRIPKMSAHVYLTVIGYVLLMSQAVLSLNPRSGWANNFKYPKKTKIYWFIQVLGSLIAVIGGLMAVIAVDQSTTVSVVIPPLPGITIVNSNHFQTAHHIVGFIALLLTAISLVGALVHLICTNVAQKSVLKAVYSCASSLTLVMAFIAICLAFDEFRGVIYDPSANMAISFTVLAVVGMIMMIIGNVTVGGRVII